MAIALFKLVMSGTTSTSANPISKRYLFKTTAANTKLSNYAVLRSKFFDDTGSHPTTATWTLATASGYYNLFVNGVLQGSSLFSVNATGLTITASVGTTLTQTGTPIILNVTNFAPTSTTTVTA